MHRAPKVIGAFLLGHSNFVWFPSGLPEKGPMRALPHFGEVDFFQNVSLIQVSRTQPEVVSFDVRFFSSRLASRSGACRTVPPVGGGEKTNCKPGGRCLTWGRDFLFVWGFEIGADLAEKHTSQNQAYQFGSS